MKNKYVPVEEGKDKEWNLAPWHLLPTLHLPLYVWGMGTSAKGSISTSALNVRRDVAGHWGQLAWDSLYVYACGLL